MKDIMYYVEREFREFVYRYGNSQVVYELMEMKSKIESFLQRKEISIKEYYRNPKREEKLSLPFTWKSIKFRITFSDKADFTITIDHSYNSTNTYNDRDIRKLYFGDPGYVYFIESEFGWKIGKTKSLKERKKIFEVRLPFNFAIKYYIKTFEMTTLENHFHYYFRDKNINGEWFLITEQNIIDASSKYSLKEYHGIQNIDYEKKYLEKISVNGL